MRQSPVLARQRHLDPLDSPTPTPCKPASFMIPARPAHTQMISGLASACARWERSRKALGTAYDSHRAVEGGLRQSPVLARQRHLDPLDSPHAHAM